MTILVLVATAVLLGAASAALSWAHARRVQKATSGNTDALAAALRRVPQDARLRELAEKAPSQSWERRMAHEALDARGPAATVAAVNDALSELDHALLSGATWPAASIRIAAFSAALIAIIAYLWTYEFRWMLVILTVGAASALLSFEAKRIARRAAAAQRAAVDALISVVFGSLVATPGEPLPGPRRRRA